MTKMEKRIESMNFKIDQQVLEIDRTQKEVQRLLNRLNEDFSLDVAQAMSNESNRLLRLFAELEGLNNQLGMLRIWAEEEEAEQND